MTSLPSDSATELRLRHDLPLVVGAGIAGLATATALAAAGTVCHIVERTAVLSELGAGIQLGPNAVRRLTRLGLLDGLGRVSAQPEAVIARDAAGGQELGRLALDAAFASRYGARYHTVHRADLHGLLLDAVRRAGVEISTSQSVTRAETERDAACVQLGAGDLQHVPWVAGCDGIWGAVRSCLGAGPAPKPTGHVAFRALLMVSDLPSGVARKVVTVWMGPRLHVVGYPVRQGELYNLVVFTETPAAMAATDDATRQLWDREVPRHAFIERLPCLASPLRALLEAPPSWGLWVLHDRDPMAGADEMACGRVLLLGDAAHPMRPYLAQGAAMAIEDAVELADQVKAVSATQVTEALRRTAEIRWARCARVQAQSRRNGRVFHATGGLQIARNLAMSLASGKLMDTPWLYAG